MELENLLKRLFDDIDFGMIKFKKNVSNEDRFLFNFFMNLNNQTLLRQILKYYRENFYSLEDLKRVVNIIKSFKGEIDIQPSDLQELKYDEYKIIKDILSDKSKVEFKKFFIKDLFYEILRTKHYTKEDLEFIKKNNLDYFIELSNKLRLNNPDEIFKENPNKIFDYINKAPNQYFLLRKLNQPIFIIKNLNSKLIITEDTIRYFLEECPLTIDLLIELRKKIPFQTIFKYAKYKMNEEMIKEIIWTKQDLEYFLSNCDRMQIIENVLKSVKETFPNFYEFFKNK